MAAQYGAMVKRMHAGRAAQSGLYGALLAARGFTGIQDVFESPYGGFCTTFSRSTDRFKMEELSSGLGERFETLRIALKFYSCVGSNHTTLDAIRDLQAAHRFTLPDIDRILVVRPQARQWQGPSPTSWAQREDLKTSLEREVYGRRWNISLAASPDFVAGMRLTSPWLVMTSGLLFSLALSIMTQVIMVARRRKALTQTLQAQLVTLIEHSSDAIVGEDPTGRIVSWNRAAEQIFGYSEAEVLGRHAASLLDPIDGVEEQNKRRARVVAGERLPAFDTQCRQRGGQWVDVSITLSAVSDTHGHIVGLAKTIRDIRDRKQVERNLREFNARLEEEVRVRTDQLESTRRDLETILDSMPALIGFWDKQLINRFANRAYERWFGLAPGELPGKLLQDVMSAELFEQSRPRLEAVLRGEAQVFERSTKGLDGKKVTHAQVHYLPDRQNGEVLGFYVLVHDITEQTESRLRLSQALRENEALLSTIKSHALYSVTDRSGHIIDVNEGFCRISGYSREELIGQTHRIVNSGHHPLSFWQAMWHTVSHGQPWHGEVCNRSKQGQQYWVDSIIAPFIGENGQIERFISIRTDITERKRAERQLAESEALLERTGRMAGIGGWQLDLKTEQLQWSRQVFELHDLPPDRPPSLEKALTFFPEDARTTMEQAIRDAKEHGHGWDLELPLVRLDGRTLWIRSVGEPEFAPERPLGPPVRLLGAIQDVTARRAADQALLRLEAAEAASAALAYTPDWKRGRVYYRSVCTTCHTSQPVGAINPSTRTKLDWAAYLKADIAKWRKVIADAKIPKI